MNIFRSAATVLVGLSIGLGATSANAGFGDIAGKVAHKVTSEVKQSALQKSQSTQDKVRAQQQQVDRAQARDDRAASDSRNARDQRDKAKDAVRKLLDAHRAVKPSS